MFSMFVGLDVTKKCFLLLHAVVWGCSEMEASSIFHPYPINPCKMVFRRYIASPLAWRKGPNVYIYIGRWSTQDLTSPIYPQGGLTAPFLIAFTSCCAARQEHSEFHCLRHNSSDGPRAPSSAPHSGHSPYRCRSQMGGACCRRR